MTTINATQIFNTINTNGASSMTAISKALGFTKKSKVVENIILELAGAGILSSTPAGGHDVWSIVSGKTLKDVEEFDDYSDDLTDEIENEVESEAVVEKVLATEAESLEEVPRISDLEIDYEFPSDLKGYAVEVTDYGFNVTFPDTGKTHPIERNERILVINEEQRVAIKSPEDLLLAVSDYSSNKGWRHYIVKDVVTGQALAPGRISIKPILIFLEVERHNKAGK